LLMDDLLTFLVAVEVESRDHTPYSCCSSAF
jgi:hypothetical protein